MLHIGKEDMFVCVCMIELVAVTVGGRRRQRVGRCVYPRQMQRLSVCIDIFSKSLVTISEELEAVYQLCCVYVIGKLFGLCETITHLLNCDVIVCKLLENLQVEFINLSFKNSWLSDESSDDITFNFLYVCCLCRYICKWVSVIKLSNTT